MAEKTSKYPRPDVVVRFYGPPGGGKTALMGEIAAMLTAKGSDAVCLEGKSGERKLPTVTPPEGRFRRPRRVLLIEQWD